MQIEQFHDGPTLSDKHSTQSHWREDRACSPVPQADVLRSHFLRHVLLHQQPLSSTLKASASFDQVYPDVAFCATSDSGDHTGDSLRQAQSFRVELASTSFDLDAPESPTQTCKLSGMHMEMSTDGLEAPPMSFCHSYSALGLSDGHCPAEYDSSFQRSNDSAFVSHRALDRVPLDEVPIEAMWVQMERQRQQQMFNSHIDRDRSEGECGKSRPRQISIEQLHAGTTASPRLGDAAGQQASSMHRAASSLSHTHVYLGQQLPIPKCSSTSGSTCPECPIAYSSSCSSNAAASPSCPVANFGAAVAASRSVSDLEFRAATLPSSVVDGKGRRARAFSPVYQGDENDIANRQQAKATCPARSPGSRARKNGPPPLIVSSADNLYVCACGKRFSRIQHLERHHRTHTQERPYTCPFPICGKTFGRADNLARHLKRHHHWEAPDGRAKLTALALAKSQHVGANLEPVNSTRHDNRPRSDHREGASAFASAAGTVSRVHAAAGAAAAAD